MSVARVTALVLWLVATAAILMVTLGPVRQRLVGSEAPNGVLSLSAWLDADTWTTGRLFEFALNLVLFVPWGALAVMALGLPRWWLAALLGFALTLTIEIAQIATPRISDPRDLVATRSARCSGSLSPRSPSLPRRSCVGVERRG